MRVGLLIKPVFTDKETIYYEDKDGFGLYASKWINIKKLRNQENLYRLRTWQIRIVFQKKENIAIIINIDCRKNIYKNL